ncbi:ribbon-helix-helix protein, CopG family [Leptolyngbya sp. FACHB-36]|uniref:ribbon-helix-helix protein, CopG family n=1 Tax=Leptolyngbya sp. FACHB-36 TaxID=2692808 RepID=UPI0016819BD4|nr:ribbon-helix-helix protein, CopG family [Leptolyngbya sp. FACHB-36]MBD2019059.1 ribbon-helix-helix protein, CopG family [Leptolyngbya sp. FACHB-36]
MPKKGQKKLRGQPEIYNEVKGQVSLSMTQTGVRGLDELAATMGLSRSEFVEQVGRRLIAVLSLEDRESVKQALQQLIATSLDELAGQNLFDGRKAEGNRAIMLQQQVKQWEKLLKKLE